jgi:hypothetical protein
MRPIASLHIRSRIRKVSGCRVGSKHSNFYQERTLDIDILFLFFSLLLRVELVALIVFQRPQ